METILVIFMALTVTGVSVWSISKKPKNKVFRYTSFEDKEHVQHVFLIYSPNFELSQQEAAKMIVISDIEIKKVEEIDVDSWETISIPYERSERNSVKIQKIK